MKPALSDIHQPTQREKKLGYIQAIKEELKKVEWTTKAELQLCTKIVIGATFLFALGIYIADLAIKGALEVVSRSLHFMFG